MTEQASTLVKTREWIAIPRIARTVPFGYRTDDDEPDLLQPVILELEALEVAKQHLNNGFSLREVAAWLTKVSGRKISHEGLSKRIASERSRLRRISALEHVARRLAETKAKIEKWEKERLGAASSSGDILLTDIDDIG